ncbi:uncharacterized protein BXZ73DRAFT_97161 [Epithele typhae]|uniref:uncharacterized protein n=1 Tax=Epithele typhae TaxID=378194 RepID=UPI002007D5FE|nr:uncharacterized protein BXZ73DRAFT_97161 [Epithele typhae]KAH9943106.1 hypothetical protein BXZ73DRAFT_97161 [Epithele typhae]
MVTQRLHAYRSIVREVSRAAIYPRATRPKVVSQHLRTVFEEKQPAQDDAKFQRDMRNVTTFLKSQQMHKMLLERYNPLLGLSVEDRVKKTANRVGLNMPITHKNEE